MEVEENDMDRQDEGIWFNTKITFVIIKKVCNEHQDLPCDPTCKVHIFLYFLTKIMFLINSVPQ